MKERYMIGIDCGVNTGIAVWDRHKKCFEIIQSTMVHRAFKLVLEYHEQQTVFVRIEDARKRHHFRIVNKNNLPMNIKNYTSTIPAKGH